MRFSGLVAVDAVVSVDRVRINEGEKLLVVPAPRFCDDPGDVAGSVHRPLELLRNLVLRGWPVKLTAQKELRPLVVVGSGNKELAVTDRACLGGQRGVHLLADLPLGKLREVLLAADRIELHGLDKADRSLLDEVGHRQPFVFASFGEADHKAKVGGDHPVEACPVSGGRPFEKALLLVLVEPRRGARPTAQLPQSVFVSVRLNRLRPHFERFYARRIRASRGPNSMFHVLHRACHTRSMRRLAALRLGWVVFAAAAAMIPLNAGAATPHIEQADLNGDINNIMSAYIQNSVSRAESDRADALLVVMNTPGGISTSMDEIVTSLLNSTVPVIVYVYPSGARAASAGLFVAQAADVLAMAPGTNIGSAHPIQATGENLTGDLGAKVLNDAVTRVRNLASMHGRNADWAEDAVRNSVNINADEAVQLHVADLEANDIRSLLNQVDGREVPRTNGSLTIHSLNAVVDDSPMPFWQIFLNALIDPTIAALLIIVAGYGIITELSNPGLILPGVIGGLAAVLAIISLANLPVNIAGALLMLLALILFVADLIAPTHGFLSVGGVFALLLGMAFLINTGPVGLGVNPVVSIGTAAVTLAFFVFFIRKVWLARRQPALSGADSMVGALGEVREELAPEGLVFVQGALWKASATSPIPAGSSVRVVGRKGLQLEVAPANGQAKEKK